MQLTVQIPDDIAHRLIEAGGDLSRRALEGMALEGMALEGMALEGMALEGMALEGMALERMAPEGMALEEFKTGNLNKPELRRLLGFGTRWQLDGLLKGSWRIRRLHAGRFRTGMPGPEKFGLLNQCSWLLLIRAQSTT